MQLDLASYRKLRDMLKANPKQETKELKEILDNFNVK